MPKTPDAKLGDAIKFFVDNSSKHGHFQPEKHNPRLLGVHTKTILDHPEIKPNLKELLEEGKININALDLQDDRHRALGANAIAYHLNKKKSEGQSR